MRADPLLNPRAQASNKGHGRTIKKNDQPKGKQKVALEAAEVQEKYRKTKEVIERVEQKVEVAKEQVLDKPFKTLSKSKLKRLMQQQKELASMSNEVKTFEQQQEEVHSHDKPASRQGSMSFLLPKKKKQRKEWD